MHILAISAGLLFLSYVNLLASCKQIYPDRQIFLQEKTLCVNTKKDSIFSKVLQFTYIFYVAGKRQRWYYTACGIEEYNRYSNF